MLVEVDRVASIVVLLPKRENSAKVTIKICPSEKETIIKTKVLLL